MTPGALRSPRGAAAGNPRGDQMAAKYGKGSYVNTEWGYVYITRTFPSLAAAAEEKFVRDPGHVKGTPKVRGRLKGIYRAKNGGLRDDYEWAVIVPPAKSGGKAASSGSGAKDSVSRFEVGKTYGNAKDLRGRFKVIARTAKTVRIAFIDNTWDGERLCKVSVVNGEERIYPDGSGYAHAPIYGVKSKNINT